MVNLTLVHLWKIRAKQRLCDANLCFKDVTAHSENSFLPVPETSKVQECWAKKAFPENHDTGSKIHLKKSIWTFSATQPVCNTLEFLSHENLCHNTVYFGWYKWYINLLVLKLAEQSAILCIQLPCGKNILAAQQEKFFMSLQKPQKLWKVGYNPVVMIIIMLA